MKGEGGRPRKVNCSIQNKKKYVGGIGKGTIAQGVKRK